MDASEILNWLGHQGRLLTDTGAMLEGLCVCLHQAGYPIVRANVQVQTMHPEVAMRLYAWRRAELSVDVQVPQSVIDRRFVSHRAGVVQEISLDHEAFARPAYRESPFRAVTEERVTVHCPIAPGQTEFPYPILADLQRMGATDYLCLPLVFASGAVSALSLATDRPGGFDPPFVQAMTNGLPMLTVCVELHSSRHITRSLLQTYLGPATGARVLSGQILRGTVRHIEAALWFSDLRGFTAMSAGMDAAGVVATLNRYFEAVIRPVDRHGGEVLKYIGDAVLAVFPATAERDAVQACRDALAAAESACSALAELNQQRTAAGLASLEHGIGLHFGQAQYGNIGAPGRLDFTVIGHDVNLASRIEGLCGRLGRPVLMSAEVQRRVPEREAVPVGRFELKGIPEAQEVYALTLASP